MAEDFENGLAQYRSGNFAEAARLFQNVLATDPRHVGALLLSAMIPAGLAAQSGNFNELIQRYEEMLLLLPDRAEIINKVGLALQALGRPVEAVDRFEQALRLRPDYKEALENLKSACREQNKPISFEDAVRHHSAGRLAEAEASYRAVLQHDPNNVAAMNNLGLIVRHPESEQLYRKALVLRPDYYDAHLNLGASLQAQDKPREAIPPFKNALLLSPDGTDPYFALGTVLTMADRFDEAAAAFARVLIIDPNYELASRNQITALESGGRLAEAEILRSRPHNPQPLSIENAPAHRRNVLILRIAAGGGMIPYYALVDQQVNTRIGWCVDFANDEQEKSLPPYDVVFNVIGNAELMGASVDRLTRFIKSCPRPVLNPPERIAPTRRDLMPRLLANIPDVVVPPVMRIARDELGGDLVAKLAAGGIQLPVIIRPISTQGGSGVVLAETPEQVAEAAKTKGDALYFIAYYNYPSADGYFRKYRTIYVDRQPFHYHLAISKKWLVHYFSAEMLAEPWKRDEEQIFLDTPEVALGARALAAVKAIGKRMNLDYCGMDYSVLPDGRIVVFEANATMSVYLPDPQDFPYKQRHVNSIFAAFESMLDRGSAMPASVGSRRRA